MSKIFLFLLPALLSAQNKITILSPFDSRAATSKVRDCGSFISANWRFVPSFYEAFLWQAWRSRRPPLRLSSSPRYRKKLFSPDFLRATGGEKMAQVTLLAELKPFCMPQDILSE
jgi:hypothetical protein